jgi:hypothetical protein
MKSIITKDFGVAQAAVFENVVAIPLANVYVMLGKALPWNTIEDIETPNDTTQYKLDCLNQGIVLKKINSSDIQVVAPRVDWATGTAYYSYHQTANLFLKSTETQISGANVNVSLSLANTIVANGANFSTATPLVSAGSLIRIGTEYKEVVRVNTSGDYLMVNTGFASAYTDNAIFKISTSQSKQYINPFYVRNNIDQVFKCMSNGTSGALSTSMPQISLDGQLPENPYIETADGYKWKYLYTIPTGLKNKFFTDKYMPVLRENIVYDNAVGGRIDVINILNGGTTYYSGSSISNYAVVTVTGDGTGASVTVDVTAGVITAVHIISGGSGYSYATITITDPLKISGGVSAVLEAVISPQYGHGYDVAREIGASDLMISVDFAGDVSGYYPIMSDGTDDYRRVCLIKDPKTVSGRYATNTLYSMFTTMYLSNPAADYGHDQNVFVGASYETATMTAKVIHFATGDNIIYVNSIQGDIANAATKTLYQQNLSSAVAQIYSVTLPTINILTGEILYIENRAPIVRNLNQTETVKIVLEF